MAPRLSMIVSTIGRPEAFARLLDSLALTRGIERCELVLIDQSATRAPTALLEEGGWPFAWRSTTSPRGLSRGRNVGLGLACGDLVAFPDDDCWYPRDVLPAVFEAFDADPALGALSGQALTARGEPCMLRWLDRPRPVTRVNYYRSSVSFTLFVRRALFARVGGFDEDLGAGSTRGFGSGEESDLVLRLLAADVAVAYRPDIVVHHDEPRVDPSPAYIDKMRGYGCGQGLLWRRHRMARSQIAYLLGRKVGGMARHVVGGRLTLGRADLAYLRGCLAGLRARPVGPGPS